MLHRRLFCFRPRATHAEGHLEVTTIVVVVIDIYLYDYYYDLCGHSEIPHGPLPSGPAASCATAVVASREEILADFAQKWAPALPVCPFPVPRAGLWPGVPTPPFVPFPGVPEPFLALRSLEGPRLPVSPGRRPFGRRAASWEYAGGARFQVRPQVWRSRVCFLASHPLLRPLAASCVPPDWPYRVSPWRR